MRQRLFLLSVALCLSSAAVCQAASSIEPQAGTRASGQGVDAFRTELESARAAYGDRRFDDACRLYPGLVADPRAARLPPAERRALFSAAGLAMRQCDRPALALKYLERATRELADPIDHFYLALVAHEMGRHAQARDVYIGYIQRWPEVADESDTELAWSLYRASSDQPQQQIRLLQALFDAGFDDPVENTSPMWFELARLHLDAGNLDKARAAVQRVNAPRSIVRMRVDRRFDAIVDRASGHFDVMRQAERAVETQSGKVDARPHDLGAWVQLTYALLDANRNDDVVNLATRLLELSNPDRPSNIKDPGFIRLDKRLWLMNNRALALYRMGQLREAVEDLKHAIRATPGDAPNVSQTLNLGTMTCRAGYPQEAVDSVRTVGQMSEYGRIVLAMVHLCAATQLDDPAGIDSALATIQSLADGQQLSLLEALLWAGRLDEAERLYLRLLDDPDERADALLLAQTFVTMDHLPVAHAHEQARKSLLARPAVRAAVEKVGRSETFLIPGSYGYD